MPPHLDQETGSTAHDLPLRSGRQSVPGHHIPQQPVRYHDRAFPFSLPFFPPVVRTRHMQPPTPSNIHRVSTPTKHQPHMLEHSRGSVRETEAARGPHQSDVDGRGEGGGVEGHQAEGGPGPAKAEDAVGLHFHVPTRRNPRPVQPHALLRLQIRHHHPAHAASPRPPPHRCCVTPATALWRAPCVRPAHNMYGVCDARRTNACACVWLHSFPTLDIALARMLASIRMHACLHRCVDVRDTQRQRKAGIRRERRKRGASKDERCMLKR